jgi:hypothetical protein
MVGARAVPADRFIPHEYGGACRFSPARMTPGGQGNGNLKNWSRGSDPGEQVNPSGSSWEPAEDFDLLHHR